MVAISLYFQIHQAYKTKKFRVYEIGNSENYFDEEKNKNNIIRLSRECYVPMNNLLLNLINKHNKEFKVTFSISGVALELLEEYAPQVIDGLKALVRTGCVEFLAETYYHSLSFLYSKQEFKRQIDLHSQAIKKHFNIEPKVFRNTELIYNNELANYIEELGYEGILSQSADDSIDFKNPNQLYIPQNSKKNITLFLRNQKLSEDISNRFEDKNWDEWPLTAQKYSNWINESENSNIVNIFLDYEIFENKKKELIKFLEELPEEFLKDKKNKFLTPTQAIKELRKKERLDMPLLITTANAQTSLNNYIGNKMQKSSIEEIFQLENVVKKTKNKEIIINWRKLTTSDNFYNMNTHYLGEECNHKSFTHENPYDAYVYFMNILNDLIIKTKITENRIKAQKEINKEPKNKGILNKIKLAVKS